jgi:DNA-binding beta-propeller fold protein YncE
MRRLLFLSLFVAAIARADSIYIASFSGSYIEKYDATGVGMPFAYGISAPEQMIFDRDGNLYLANYNQSTNSVVLKFDTNGIVSVFVSSTNGANGLAFDRDGNLFVANFDGGTIDKFSPSGAYLGQFAGGLNHPIVLAFAPDGDLLVSTYDNVIEEFSPEGTDLGAAVSGLYGPTGMALDNAGNIYVSSFWGNEVDKYSLATGAFLGAVDTTANEPYYLSFDSAGNLYVPNFGNNTVQKITPDGTVSTFATIAAPSGLAVWPGLQTGTGIAGNAAANLTLKRPAPGQMILRFTGSSSASYTVLAATNMFLPLTNWTILGAATWQSNDIFQFTDTHATNHAKFYGVRSP